MLNVSLFERHDVYIKLVYRLTSQRVSSSMNETVRAMNQDRNDTLAVSNVHESIKDNRERSVQDKLRDKRKRLINRGKRITIDILKILAKGESVIWELGDVPDSLLELFQNDTLYT